MNDVTDQNRRHAFDLSKKAQTAIDCGDYALARRRLRDARDKLGGEDDSE